MQRGSYNGSQQVITVLSHFKFVLIVVVPVGFVSRDFCAKASFFLLNSREGVRMKMPYNHSQLNMFL